MMSDRADTCTADTRQRSPGSPAGKQHVKCVLIVLNEPDRFLHLPGTRSIINGDREGKGNYFLQFGIGVCIFYGLRIRRQ